MKIKILIFLAVVCFNDSLFLQVGAAPHAYLPPDSPVFSTSPALRGTRLKGYGRVLSYDSVMLKMGEIDRRFSGLFDLIGDGYLLHGSSSSSLLGLSSGIGLRPTGWLLDRGMCVFCGALDTGLGGANREYLSSFFITEAAGLEYYARATTYSPIRDLADLKKLRKIDKAKYVPLMQDSLNQFERLVTNRIQQFGKMPDSIRSFVKDQYPVIYAINPHGLNIVAEHSDVGRALGIWRGAGPKSITAALVPEEKIRMTQVMLGGRSKHIRVGNILKFLK